MGDAVRCEWKCGGVYTPSMPSCLSPSGWNVLAWGKPGGDAKAGEGSAEKRRMRPPQRLETDEVRKVDEVGEGVPNGGVMAPGEDAG
jgi:hypothetical protein